MKTELSGGASNVLKIQIIDSSAGGLPAQICEPKRVRLFNCPGVQELNQISGLSRGPGSRLLCLYFPRYFLVPTIGAEIPFWNSQLWGHPRQIPVGQGGRGHSPLVAR